MSWAVLAFSLAACIAQVHPLRTVVADALLDDARDAGPLATFAALVGASAVVGGVMGRIAARLPGGPARRVALLSLLGVPALGLIVAATWALGWAPRVIAEEPSRLLWMPLGALWVAGVAIVAGAPLLLPPVVLAAVLLEGWTRPESLPPTGLARPGPRRAVLLTVVAVAAALSTVVGLRWRG